MHPVSVKEWELLSLFEAEPDLAERADPWDLNDALYRVADGDSPLSFAIAPYYGDVRIVLEHGHRRVYELNATGVVDVRYRREQGAEMLEIVRTGRSTIVLRAKPRIELEHRVSKGE